MEILTSFVGTIGGEIAKYTLIPLGRQIGYLIFYSRNINNLREVLQKLNDEKTAVSQQVNADRRNLIEPAPKVITWQQNVDVIDGQATTFLDEELMKNRKCLNDLCPNPKSRYSLSRKATKMKKRIRELLDEAKEFSPTKLPAVLPSLGSAFNTEDVKEFESRNKIMEEILEALRDDSLSMMSICGPGGVGKTTMVKKLLEVVASQKLFDEVAMVAVSQNPNVKNIQFGIASCLGLTFDSEDEQGRARKLHIRILSSRQIKILLILDDVWAEMNFEKFGIPSAGKRAGYKILLTSRMPSECQKMGSLKDFHVDPLKEKEGWNLFKGIAFAGNSIGDEDDLLQLAMQIADECDGLPICIVTIAKALKGRDRVVWSDALTQLRNSNYQGISGMDKVFSRLELSYDLLQFEDAKAIFLLCCLFPEGYAIRIEHLVWYAVGLRLLACDETILEARNRVHTLIFELKESFLLLNCGEDGEGYVRMHDVLRDVAISIASKRKSYLVCCDKWVNHWPNKWRGKYNECTAISLWCEEIEEHPADLACPKLQLLQLHSSGSLPDNFFQGMEDLKVIALDGCFPPKSLHAIKKVRTLRLLHMQSKTSIGDLEDVEILEIRTMEKLPYGVGLMKNLRLLDLRGVWISILFQQVYFQSY